MTEETDEEDQHWLILKNVDNLPPAYGGPFVFPGSTKLRADCGCECWIAPLALQALGNPANSFLTICTDHLAKSPELQEGIRANGLRAIAGQDLELAAVLGDGQVAELFRRLRIRMHDTQSS